MSSKDVVKMLACTLETRHDVMSILKVGSTLVIFSMDKSICWVYIRGSMT